MRAFSKLVVMLYKTNVLSEEVILKWYREPNSSKGKMMFLDQMKKFVEWLQSAEEGEEILPNTRRWSELIAVQG